MRDEALSGIRGTAESLLYREPCRLNYLRLDVDHDDVMGKVCPVDRTHKATRVPIDVIETYFDLYDDTIKGINPFGMLDRPAVNVGLIINEDRVTFEASDGQTNVFCSYDAEDEALEEDE